MIKEIKFLWFTIIMNFYSSSELRSSFVASIIGMAINNTAFVIVWFVFGSLASGLGGWTAYDALGLIGFSSIGYGLCFAFLGGIRRLPEMVATGEFDKFLISPKNILLRVSSSVLIVSAIGDILIGVILISMWIYYIGFSFGVLSLTLLLSICSSIFHFTFSVFANSLSFYFQEPRPVVQGVFELFMGPSLVQGGAIQGGFRKFFSLVVPALLVGTFPVEIIRDGDVGKLILILALTLFWLALSIWFFYFSLKRYESANFVNF